MAEAPLRNQFIGQGTLKVDGPSFAASLWRANIAAHDLEEHAHDRAHFVLALDQGFISEAIRMDDFAPAMTLVYSPPGTVHRDRCPGIGACFLTVEIEPSLVSKSVTDPLWIKDGNARYAAGRVAGKLASLGPDEDDDDEIYDAILTMLAGTRPQRSSASSPSSPPWLTEGLDALRDLSSNSCARIGDIANSVGIHPVHFSRSFKDHFGCSPSLMLRRYRVWRAAGMMSGGKGFAQIAFDCGFADQSHLSRSFNQILGTSPGRLRNGFLGGPRHIG